jgi:hypothetical protein
MRFLYFTTVYSHLIFSDPSVWDGGEPLYELERPMLPSTVDESWFCKGHSRKVDASVLELVPGSTVLVPIICGEAPIGSNQDQATQFCDSDKNSLHGGNSGCVLSIADGDSNDFTIITVTYECPKLDWSSVAFVIPEGLPELTNGKCSWSWVPNILSAQQESYNNCFSCSVKSDTKGLLTGGTKLKSNPVSMYRDTFPDRPLYDWKVNRVSPNKTSVVNTTVETSTKTKCRRY